MSTDGWTALPFLHRNNASGPEYSSDSKEPQLFSTKFRADWWKYLLLAAFLLLTGILILIHAPWHDEVQAWLMARDSNPWSLLFHYLRYEGHPGLWYLLLMIPAKLKLPLVFLNLLSVAFMALAAYLILFRSPFPTIIKVLLPFSYFFFYQYAVIARSYALIPPLLFSVAVLYRRKNERPLIYFTLLILLACVSLHGTLIALSLLLLHLGDLRKGWAALSPGSRKRNIVGLLMFALVLVIMIIMLVPPPDISSAQKYNFGIKHFLTVTYHALDISLASHWFISFPALAVLLAWLFKKKLLFMYLVLTVPLLVFFAVVYSVVHHYGILLFVLIFVLWLSFNDENLESGNIFKINDSCFKQAAVAALTVVLLFQIYYSVQSFRMEFKVKYSSSYSIAKYIKENHLEGKKINMVGMQTPILAYFDDNIFSNYNDGHKPCFWLYSKKNDYIAKVNEKNILKAISDKPDYIIALHYALAKKGLDIPGYKAEVLFYGQVICRGETSDLDSAILYKRE